MYGAVHVGVGMWGWEWGFASEYGVWGLWVCIWLCMWVLVYMAWQGSMCVCVCVLHVAVWWQERVCV